MITFKEILNGPDFNCLNENNKNLLYNYIEHFSNKKDNLKKIFESILYIIKNNISDSVDDKLEKFNRELIKDIQNNNSANMI